MHQKGLKNISGFKKKLFLTAFAAQIRFAPLNGVNFVS